jgi:hypothetical protein
LRGPPNVNAPLGALAAIPPSPVAKVLEEVSAHAVELTTNLENFTAEEGRAWVSMENGQPLHMETNLMHDIPAMGLRSSAISVDYAPVQIQTRNLELWLPKRVKAYWEISNRRIILYHSYSNFQLFTVDTRENTQKPKRQ